MIETQPQKFSSISAKNIQLIEVKGVDAFGQTIHFWLKPEQVSYFCQEIMLPAGILHLNGKQV